MPTIIYVCPKLPLSSCVWEGRAADLLSHFRRHHSDLVLIGCAFDIDIATPTYTVNKLLHHDAETFLVQLQKDADVVRLRLRYLGGRLHAARKRYALEVHLGDETFSSRDACALLRNMDDGIAVHLAAFPSYGGDCRSLFCRLCIDDWISCTNCGEKMLAPIFICMNGHSVCARCYVNSNCRLCKATITDLHNVDLEELTRTLQYRCRFNCGLILLGGDVKRHELQCNNYPYKCPLCTLQASFKIIDNHCKVVHPSVKRLSAALNDFPPFAVQLLINPAYGIFYCESSVESEMHMRCTIRFCGVNELEFRCEIIVYSKKSVLRTYTLRSYRNRCEFHVPFGDLKHAKLKRTRLQIVVL